MKLFYLLLIITFLPAKLLAVTGTVPNEERMVTLKADSMPLVEVINLISEQTGYTISIDEAFAEVSVIGEYENVSIERFFQRVLRENNVSVHINEVKSEISVHFFGNKNSGKYITSSSSNSFASAEKQKIAARHQEQYEELEAILNDPESVDPQTGMKLTEIRKKNEQQKRELELIKKDPNSLDPQSGMTIASISKKNRVQQQQLDKVRQDPNHIVDAEAGETRAALQLRHERQLREFQENINHYIDPDTGESVADIKAKHEQQARELALY